MNGFSILQKFLELAKPPKPVVVKQVDWSPPTLGYILNAIQVGLVEVLLVMQECC